MREPSTTYACHRCGADLPLEPPRGEAPALFCPHCGAPQVLMPEEMRSDLQAESTLATAPVHTTGTVPPPRPRVVDWRAVLVAAIPVALVAGLLTALSMFSDAAVLLEMLWVLGSGGVVLALYSRQRPQARIDASVGLRVGVTVGLLTAAVLLLTLATVGTVARFGLHRMSGFDAAVAQATNAMKNQMAQALHDQNQPADVSAHILSLAGSDEVHAGAALAYAGVLGAFILGVTAAGGSFVGMLAMRRGASRRLT